MTRRQKIAKAYRAIIKTCCMLTIFFAIVDNLVGCLSFLVLALVLLPIRHALDQTHRLQDETFEDAIIFYVYIVMMTLVFSVASYDKAACE